MQGLPIFSERRRTKTGRSSGTSPSAAVRHRWLSTVPLAVRQAVRNPLGVWCWTPSTRPPRGSPGGHARRRRDEISSGPISPSNGNTSPPIPEGMENAGRIGRPPLDRDLLLFFLWDQPRRGRRLIMFNCRAAAKNLGWHRKTVSRALRDLEEEGFVRRFPFGSRGRLGTLLILEPRDHWLRSEAGRDKQP